MGRADAVPVVGVGHHIIRAAVGTGVSINVGHIMDRRELIMKSAHLVCRGLARPHTRFRGLALPSPAQNIF